MMKENFPDNWSIAELDDLIIRMTNGANVKQYDESIGLPISRIETIWNGKIDTNRVKYIKEKDSDFIAKYRLSDGDILFSHINSDNHLGKTSIYKGTPKILIHGINLLLIRLSPLLHSGFFNYHFQFLKYKGAFIDVAQRAVNQSSINQAKLKSFLFSVPPINEQKRIVAKIEELFSELDKGIESLKAARGQLKVYRQSVLKHAFEGKLTAKWREENKDKLESTDQLLTRIKQEREVHYQQQLKDWNAVVTVWEKNGKVGKKPSKPKAIKTIAKLSESDLSGLSALQKGWACEKIGNLFDVVSGGTPKGLNSIKGLDVPFYRVSDMNAEGNEVDMKKSATYLSFKEIEGLGLTLYPSGTIIFPKRGGAILTNKKRMLSSEACFDLNTMGIVNQAKSIMRRFLWYWFSKLDLARIYDGSNVPQINNKNVEPLAFHFCSIKEQEIIVKELDLKLSDTDALIHEIELNLKKAEALRQSILKKAFSGQLVEQDPKDEPTSILLERIKAEKSAPAKNNIVKNTKKKRKNAA
jgi:type I restriction enzyme, S subunit